MATNDRWIFAPSEIVNNPSCQGGCELDKELNYRQQSANMIQDMGQKLKVTQLCINTAIVYMHRFYMIHSFQKFSRNSISAACLFLSAKVEEQPRKLEHVISVMQNNSHRVDVRSESYLKQAQELVQNENILLQTLGFQIQISHPHALVVKTCELVRAGKDLVQTAYFLATNSLHLSRMCIQYKPSVVACVCIHLACKWSNMEIPPSTEDKEWFTYTDPGVTHQMLEELTQEFLSVMEQCPSKLKKKIMSWKPSKEQKDDVSALQGHLPIIQLSSQMAGSSNVGIHQPSSVHMSSHHSTHHKANERHQARSQLKSSSSRHSSSSTKSHSSNIVTERNTERAVRTTETPKKMTRHDYMQRLKQTSSSEASLTDSTKLSDAVDGSKQHSMQQLMIPTVDSSELNNRHHRDILNALDDLSSTESYTLKIDQEVPNLADVTSRTSSKSVQSRLIVDSTPKPPQDPPQNLVPPPPPPPPEGGDIPDIPPAPSFQNPEYFDGLSQISINRENIKLGKTVETNKLIVNHVTSKHSQHSSVLQHQIRASTSSNVQLDESVFQKVPSSIQHLVHVEPNEDKCSKQSPSSGPLKIKLGDLLAKRNSPDKPEVGIKLKINLKKGISSSPSTGKEHHYNHHHSKKGHKHKHEKHEKHKKHEKHSRKRDHSPNNDTASTSKLPKHENDLHEPPDTNGDIPNQEALMETMRDLGQLIASKKKAMSRMSNSTSIPAAPPLRPPPPSN